MDHHVRLSGALSPRPRRPERGLPRPPPRTRGSPRPRVRHLPHHPPGRPRRRTRRRGARPAIPLARREAPPPTLTASRDPLAGPAQICSIIPIRFIGIREGVCANGDLETGPQFLPLTAHGDAWAAGEARLRGCLEPWRGLE